MAVEFMNLWPCGSMVLWFYGYTASLGHDFMTLGAFPGFYGPLALWLCGSIVMQPRPAPVLASARPGASLGHDFMLLRAFPGFYGPMALWLCGSMALRPRSDMIS